MCRVAAMGIRPCRRVLVVPGRDESVNDVRRWFESFDDVVGIDFDQQMAGLDFRAQVARVAHLLDGGSPDELLLAGRSFGAWILLHALLDRASPFAGTVLLLAPVLGYGGRGCAGFIAPRARPFWTSVRAGRSIPALRLILVAGRHDSQCPIELARELATCWPIELYECESDHTLGPWTSADVDRILRT
jgi:predicted esterase